MVEIQVFPYMPPKKRRAYKPRKLSLNEALQLAHCEPQKPAKDVEEAMQRESDEDIRAAVNHYWRAD